jgi:uncharacterized protein (DUF58 family)
MPVDIVLLLDVSRSMEPHIRRVATASHQALRALGDQDRVAIMVFDRFTRVRLPFRSDRQDAERELESVLDRESLTVEPISHGERHLHRAERAAHTPGNCHCHRRSDRARPKRSCGLARADARRLRSERSDRAGCAAYGNRRSAPIDIR